MPHFTTHRHVTAPLDAKKLSHRPTIQISHPWAKVYHLPRETVKVKVGRLDKAGCVGEREG